MARNITQRATAGTRIFQLWEIPMTRPAVLTKALRHLDEDAVRQAGQPYPPKALRELLGGAVESGQVRSVLAEVPTKGIRRFVDLATFPEEFNAYLSRVQGGGRGRVVSLASRSAEKDGARRNVWRLLVSRVTKRPAVFGMAARLCFRPEHFVALALGSDFAPDQIIEEICPLLRLVQRMRPRYVLEVGTCRGGTLYLLTRFAHPAASLACVDLRLPDPALLRSFARPRQRVTPIEGDSGAATTVQTVQRLFPAPLDFVFLDGDHSYDGIKRDFLTYEPMVRPGGMIVFHDIVEDNETRYGVITGGWSGGVPRFWNEVKAAYRHAEFVKDRRQDAYGIGVLFKSEAPKR
jgi:cephalosporin hydroxylase